MPEPPHVRLARWSPLAKAAIDRLMPRHPDVPSRLWIHRPDMWSGAVLGVALAARSFRPSLMPRATAHQAVVAGASGALGFGIGNAVYGAAVHTGSAPIDLAVLGVAGVSGFSLSRLLPEPEESDPSAPPPQEPSWRPIARTAGSAVAAGSAAAGLGVLVRTVPKRHRKWAGLALLTLSAGTGVRAVIAGVQAQAKAHTEYDPPPPRALPAVGQSMGIAVGLTTVVTAFRHTSGVVSKALQQRLGVPHVPAVWLGRGISVGAWFVVTKALADQLVNGLRTFDRVVDAGFDRAPTSPFRSSGEGSPIAFARLGREGRRFVLNVPEPSEITEVMGVPSVAEPIRIFVGYAAARTDEDRIALAVDELRRTGALDRKLIVVGCAAGNGYVNTLALEVADYLMLGDTASVSIQYGRLPSILTLKRVTRGGRVQGALLDAIRAEVADRPESERPKVVVYGESLGAWAGQDTFLHHGLDGFDEKGVDKALWVGTPYYSGWRREVVVERSIDVPPGTVMEVDRPDPLLALSDDERSRLRAVIVGHGNDPVRYLSLGVFVRRPDWLRRTGDRPWGVPPKMQFLPGITGIQLVVDALNAMRPVPGVFRATGHEYNGDVPDAVAVAYDLDKPEPAVWEGLIAHLQQVDERRASHSRHGRKRASEDNESRRAADGPDHAAQAPDEVEAPT